MAFEQNIYYEVSQMPSFLVFSGLQSLRKIANCILMLSNIHQLLTKAFFFSFGSSLDLLERCETKTELKWAGLCAVSQGEFLLRLKPEKYGFLIGCNLQLKQQWEKHYG